MTLKKLTFQIGEKEIELTEVEALELKVELDKIFGKPIEYWIPTYPSPSIPEPRWPWSPIVW